MDTFWKILTSVGLSMLGGLGTYLVAKLTSKWEKSKQDIVFNKNNTIINQIIKYAVNTTNQLYVKDLKVRGEFNEEAQKKAYTLTYNMIMEQLSRELQQFIVTYYGDLNSFLKMRIESTIYKGE